jgi:hypothetical protein
MSTTYYTFTGNETTAPTFTPTLDGTQYNLVCKWNLYSQRWYAVITDSSGTLILCRPLVESPIGYDINILFGVFTSTTLVWRVDNGQIEVTA